MPCHGRQRTAANSSGIMQVASLHLLSPSIDISGPTSRAVPVDVKACNALNNAVYSVMRHKCAHAKATGKEGLSMLSSG